MIDLERRPEISVLARMSGRVLTVIVLKRASLKLVRTVELADTSHDEMLAVLFPTMAFIEDQFQAKPARVLFCGIGRCRMAGKRSWERRWKCCKSQFGTPNQFNAGLHGYLQSISEGAGASAA